MPSWTTTSYGGRRLFAALDDAAAAALRATMSQETVGRGDVVFSEGEPGDRLFIIVDGKIKLGQTSSDGREQVMAVLGPVRCSASCPCSTPEREPLPPRP